jgi:hypothetical protein
MEEVIISDDADAVVGDILSDWRLKYANLLCFFSATDPTCPSPVPIRA